MKLKCIGGELDGSIRETYDYNKVGDYVKLQKPTEYKISDLNYNKIPEFSMVNFVIYQIDKIIYHDNSRDREPHIKMFLRPTDWSTWQCISHLFDSHNEKAKTFEDHQRAIEQHYAAIANLER